MTKRLLLLTDLIDLEHLQNLQDCFAAATRVTTVIVDPRGQSITIPSNWNGLCNLFQASSTADKCQAYTAMITEAAGKNLRPHISKCPQMGLTTAAVPIIVEGQYLGSWIFAQMRLNDVSLEEILTAAAGNGADREEIRNRLETLPVFTMQDFERFFLFIQSLTQTIAYLGHNNLRLRQKDRELRGMAEQMAIRDAVLTKLNQTSQEPFYICDFYTGEMLMVNNAFCELSGLAMDQILGRKCWEVLGTGVEFCDLCPREALLENGIDSGKRETTEYYNGRLNRWLRCTHEAITWSGGRAAHMVTQQDVTGEREMRERLEKMAYYDNVSGLPNMNRLKEDLKSAVMRGGRSLICIHLPFMPAFTDVYGNVAEEQLNKTIAEWLTALAPAEYTAYRLNRNDFFLMLHKRNRSRSLELAEKIRKRFTRPWLINLGESSFSFVGSASVVVFTEPVCWMSDQDAHKLVIRMFDEARRRDGLVVYDEKLDNEIRQVNRLRIALEDSVKRNMHGFSVVYQPIMELASGKWKGVEALCRWVGPDGPVSPAVFIPEAEAIGLITPIGVWVLETAVRTAKEFGLDEIEGFYLSVNMSPRQMMDPGFADTVAVVLRKHDFKGACLNMEITESSEVNFTDFTISVIKSLGEQGVTLALDDFGTGYSSFNNLKNLPVNYLKTEQQFIQGIEEDSYQQYFIYVMSEIAHAHGMKLIAEGVETEEQLRIARSNGADCIQGNFFSKPLTREQLLARKEAFLVQDSSFIPQSAQAIGIRRWLSGKSAYEFTPSLFNVLHECMQVVLSDLDLEASFHSILGLVGRHFGVSRSYVFLRRDDGLYNNSYEWRAEGVSSHRNFLSGVDIEGKTPSLVMAFSEEGMVIASDIAKLPADLYSELKPLDITSVALMPLWQEGELAGLVGFDSDIMVEWSPDAIVMLWNLEMVIANLLSKHRLKSDIFEKNTLLNAILVSPSLYCYVSDPDTYEIVWISDSAYKGLQLPADAIGGKCHKVMAGIDKPCPMCPLPRLSAMPDLAQAERTVYNSYLDKTLACYDCLFPWKNGQRMHLAYFLDLSDRRVIASMGELPQKARGR